MSNRIDLKIEHQWRNVRIYDISNPSIWAAGLTVYQALGHFVQGHLEIFQVKYCEFHCQKQKDRIATDFEWWGRWLIENASRFNIIILE